MESEGCWSILRRIKTPLPETQKTGVIYEIPSRCGQVYIGETCKTLNYRMKEHSVQRIDTNNSLAAHVKEASHDISWENAKVLQGKQHKIRRKIKLGGCTNTEDTLHEHGPRNELGSCVFGMTYLINTTT